MRISFVLFRKDAIVSSDSLGPHRDLGFGTWDKVPADFSQDIGGGWWYDNSSAECAVRSNLNGVGNETKESAMFRNFTFYFIKST